jgi:hypothetical protein
MLETNFEARLRKLLSATFALSRESLVAGLEADTEPHVVQDVEIHCPSPYGNFILIIGPPTLVL